MKNCQPGLMQAPRSNQDSFGSRADKRAERSDIEREYRTEARMSAASGDRDFYQTVYGAPGDYPACD